MALATHERHLEAHESHEAAAGANGQPGQKKGLLAKFKGDKKLQVVAVVLALVGVIIAYIELRKSSASSSTTAATPTTTDQGTGTDSGTGGGWGSNPWWQSSQYTAPTTDTAPATTTDDGTGDGSSFFVPPTFSAPAPPATAPAPIGGGGSTGAAPQLSVFQSALNAASSALAAGPSNDAQVAHVQSLTTAAVSAATTPQEVAAVQPLVAATNPIGSVNTLTSQYGTAATAAAATQYLNPAPAPSAGDIAAAQALAAGQWAAAGAAGASQSQIATAIANTVPNTTPEHPVSPAQAQAATTTVKAAAPPAKLPAPGVKIMPNQ